jgi:hypothetical protein
MSIQGRGTDDELTRELSALDLQSENVEHASLKDSDVTLFGRSTAGSNASPNPRHVCVCLCVCEREREICVDIDICNIVMLLLDACTVTLRDACTVTLAGYTSFDVAYAAAGHGGTPSEEDEDGGEGGEGPGVQCAQQ